MSGDRSPVPVVDEATTSRKAAAITSPARVRSNAAGSGPAAVVRVPWNVVALIGRVGLGIDMVLLPRSVTATCGHRGRVSGGDWASATVPTRDTAGTDPRVSTVVTH
jgi:hypothetical protein